MSKRITGEELTAIRERAEKATGGDERLYVEKHCEDDYDIVDYSGDIQFAAFDRDTATFIAHARQDIPKLLAEIGRMQDLLKKAYLYGVSSEAYQNDEDIREIYKYLYGGDSE